MTYLNVNLVIQKKKDNISKSFFFPTNSFKLSACCFFAESSYNERCFEYKKSLIYGNQEVMYIQTTLLHETSINLIHYFYRAYNMKKKSKTALEIQAKNPLK